MYRYFMWLYRALAVACCVAAGIAMHWLMDVQDFRVFAVLTILLFIWWLSAMDYLERKLEELKDGKD